MKTSALKAVINRAIDDNPASLRTVAKVLRAATSDGAEISFVVRRISNAHGLIGWSARNTWPDVATSWAYWCDRRAEKIENENA